MKKIIGVIAVCLLSACGSGDWCWGTPENEKCFIDKESCFKDYNRMSLFPRADDTKKCHEVDSE